MMNLNLMVALDIVGWERDGGMLRNAPDDQWVRTAAELPGYTTEIADALYVLEIVRRHGWSVVIESGIGGGWEVEMVHGPETLDDLGPPVAEGVAFNLATAICLAAVKARHHPDVEWAAAVVSPRTDEWELAQGPVSCRECGSNKVLQRKGANAAGGWRYSCGECCAEWDDDSAI